MTHSSRPKQAATIKKRPALRELRQEPARTLRHQQSLIDRPHDTKSNKTEQKSEYVGPRTRRSYQNVQDHRRFEIEYGRMLQDPLEFGAINNPHTNESSKRRRHHNADAFEIHIPIDPSSGPVVSKDKELPPRPRTSRGRQQDGAKQPPPPTASFTTLFPPAGHIASQLALKRLSDEQQVSRFSMTTSDDSASEASAPGTAMYDSSGSDIQSGQSTPRKSKFLEGSMSERSQGVASSWDPDRFESSQLADISDADEPTPKPAGRLQQKSKLSESIQVHEPTKLKLEGRDDDTKANVAKSTTKMHHFGQDPAPTSTIKHQRSKGLGLRSSISTFNFQGLSDKFKLFGSSKSSKKPTPTATNEDQAYKAMMNERKRKAEIAYAEQFGSIKKRKHIQPVQIHQEKAAPTDSHAQKDDTKDTSTSTTSTSTSTGTTNTHTAASSKPGPVHFSRPLTAVQTSNPHSADPAVTNATTTSHSRPHPSSHGGSSTPSSKLTTTKTTVKKRPSRKDLEKENAHLRALLAAATSLQTLHQQHQHQHHISPPPPPVPLMPTVPKMPPGLSAKGKENVVAVGKGLKDDEEVTGRQTGVGAGAGGVKWEWPEDCF